MSGTCLLLVPSPASYMANCPSSGCSSLWTSWELSLAILMLFHGMSGESMKQEDRGCPYSQKIPDQFHLHL